jgi:hypothetical protein
MRSLLIVTCGSLVAVACSASGRFPGVTDAGSSPSPDAAAARDGSTKTDAAMPSFVPDAGLEGKTCERAIDVGALTLSMSACFVNEHVANRSGKLVFPCKGGDASIDFSGKVFEGTVDGDELELTLVEPFVFNSCQWESTETIKGDLSTSTLAYTYTERKLANCTDTPCTADGTLKVESGEVVVVK